MAMAIFLGGLVIGGAMVYSLMLNRVHRLEDRLADKTAKLNVARKIIKDYERDREEWQEVKKCDYGNLYGKW